MSTDPSKAGGEKCRKSAFLMARYLLPHLGWIAARAPNRVNRAHWPTKENKQNFGMFVIFPAHTKNGPRWPQMGPGRFFPTNPNLADILGNTDLNLAWAGLGPWAGVGPRGAQVGSQEFGTQKKQKNKNSQNPNRFCLKMSARSGLVGKNPPGPIWGLLGRFFARARKM